MVSFGFTQIAISPPVGTKVTSLRNEVPTIKIENIPSIEEGIIKSKSIPVASSGVMNSNPKNTVDEG